MKIRNIVLINRDSKQEYELREINDETQLCYLSLIAGIESKISLNLFSILNSLNTPNGAWSLKVPAEKSFIYDTEVWVKGKLLSEYENNCDLIEIDEVGHPRQLTIRRFNQLRKRVFK